MDSILNVPLMVTVAILLTLVTQTLGIMVTISTLAPQTLGLMVILATLGIMVTRATLAAHILGLMFILTTLATQTPGIMVTVATLAAHTLGLLVTRPLWQLRHWALWSVQTLGPLWPLKYGHSRLSGHSGILAIQSLGIMVTLATQIWV